MNHYETLGVTQDATETDIKRAYRSKAREHHPDKGGSDESFAPVAEAYSVLRDPERRLLYDITGEDSRPPIEKGVEQILLGLFNEALASEEDIEMLAFVKHRVNKVSNEIPIAKKNLMSRKGKLQKRRGKIRSKGVNVVHMIIDGELKGIEGQLLQLDHQSEVNKACLVALESYEEDWEAPPKPEYSMFDLRSPLRQSMYEDVMNDLKKQRPW